MTHDIDLTGVFPAMPTPFDADERIDFDQLRADARRLEGAGVDGVVPCGTTGESATLTHEEHVRVIEAVVDSVDVPVIAGSGSNNTREALELSERAADVGADALLLISPYYNRPEQDGLLEHYRTIADAVDLPQVLYNVPSRTGGEIGVDTAVELAAHENVVGYKAAGGDLGRIGELIERTRDREFSVLSGDDALTLPICSLGGRGTISVAANVEPERVSAMVGAAVAGDGAAAREWHHELAPLFRALFVETNPIPVKEALGLRTGRTPVFRPPMTRLSPGNRDELADVLAALDDRPVPEVPA